MEPLKLTKQALPTPEYCGACNTTLDSTHPASMDDPCICSECAKLTHFERELLWALNRIGESLERAEADE